MWELRLLELDQNIYRRSLKISRDGLADKKKFDIWKVDQQNDKYTGIVRREECLSVHNTYINPLANHKYSPNMVLGHCSFLNGNSGAPIIDSTGKLRALANGDIDRSIIKFLEENGFFIGDLVAPMMLVNNMACTTNIDDNEGYPDRECVKELSDAHLVRLRGQMIDANSLFNDYLKETQSAVAQNNQFVNFDVKLIENTQGKFNIQFYPRCFINAEQWRNRPPRSKSFTVSSPYYDLARASDAYTRLKVNMINSRNTQFKIEFDPRTVLDGKSSVSIKSNVFSTSYSNIPSNCTAQQVLR
jgi:hypothetical protein